MATGGLLGNGVRVGFSSTSPVSFTSLANVLDVKFPTETPDKIDKTTHGSSKYKKNFPGMVEVGDMEVTLLGDLDQATSAEIETLWAYAQAQTELWWRVEVPTNRAKTRFRPFEFYGYPANVEPGTPVQDKQTIKFTVVHSGEGIARYNATNSPTLS
jgi:hypothetical protein